MTNRPPGGSGRPGGPGPLEWRVERLGTVGSTQDLARERRLPDGGVLVAAEQASGRGRRRRDWTSPPGGLWATAALDAARLARLAPGAWPAAVALSLAECVAGLGAEVRVKWPNDLYLVAPRVGKLAGVLLERVGQRLLVGVGMNVRNEAPDGGAALCEAVPAVGVDGALGALLDGLRAATRLVPDDLVASWSLRDLLAGSAVTIDDGAASTAGVAAGIDRAGRLRLRTAGGEVGVARGHVATWRPMPPPS